MAQYCQKCHKTMNDTQFYTYKNGDKTEMCKNCLTLHVNNFEPDTFLWLLEKMDVPYIPSEWNVLRDRDYAKDPNKIGGAAVFGKYLAKMKLKQWNKYGWADSEALQAEEKQKAEEHAESVKAQEEWATEQFQNGEISEAEYKTLTSSLKQELDYTQGKIQREYAGAGIGYNGAPAGPNAIFSEANYMRPEDMPHPSEELTEDDKMYLVMKWGRLYSADEWVELERMYKEMENSFDIQDADTINALVLICKLNLKANQALDQGDYDGFAKLSRSLESMRKSAKFTAAQKKEEKVDAVDCVGELVSMCEREGFIPRYATDIPQDKVDVTLRDMNEYVQKLVTQDLGFGQQIEDALKKIQLQKEMQEKESELWAGEDTLSDEDYQAYFEEVESQKERDLDTIESEEDKEEE